MKNKIFKILAMVFCMALFLTGCATVSMPTDNDGKNIYFDTPVYFEGQVAKIGDYLYYGNGYADIADTAFNYTESAKLAYLARLNLTDIGFDEEVLDVNYNHSSPLGIEKVNGDKVIGYANQMMYAYGEYLYFTSANIHKTSDMLNEYEKVSLFRMKFDGDALQEIGTFGYDENSTITLQRGSDDNYYFVVVAPTETKEETEGEEEVATYDIFSVQVGQSVGQVEKLVEKVDSAVVADETSTQRNVVYSFDPESERLVDAISSVDFATGDVTVHDRGRESEITLIDRIGDEVFYSYANEVYFKNVKVAGTFTAGANQFFFSAPTISELEKVGDGYVFKGSSALLYKSSLTASTTPLVSATDYSGATLLFADGDYVYYSTGSAIIRKSVNNAEAETLVSGMTIISGKCGYDGDNIYFYANRGELQVEEGTETDETEEAETDSNFYLYQVDKNGNIQLLSQIED